MPKFYNQTYEVKAFSLDLALRPTRAKRESITRDVKMMSAASLLGCRSSLHVWTEMELRMIVLMMLWMIVLIDCALISIS